MGTTKQQRHLSAGSSKTSVSKKAPKKHSKKPGGGNGSSCKLEEGGEGPRRRNWTAAEDEILKQRVAQLGTKEWNKVAESLPSRTGKQCYQRWFYALEPYMSSRKWQPQEDLAIMHYHKLYGNRWTKISTFLLDRSGYSVKNRFRRICNAYGASAHSNNGSSSKHAASRLRPSCTIMATGSPSPEVSLSGHTPLLEPESPRLLTPKMEAPPEHHPAPISQDDLRDEKAPATLLTPSRQHHHHSQQYQHFTFLPHDTERERDHDHHTFHFSNDDEAFTAPGSLLSNSFGLLAQGSPSSLASSVCYCLENSSLPFIRPEVLERELGLHMAQGQGQDLACFPESPDPDPWGKLADEGAGRRTHHQPRMAHHRGEGSASGSSGFWLVGEPDLSPQMEVVLDVGGGAGATTNPPTTMGT